MHGTAGNLHPVSKHIIGRTIKNSVLILIGLKFSQQRSNCILTFRKNGLIPSIENIVLQHGDPHQAVTCMEHNTAGGLQKTGGTHNVKAGEPMVGKAVILHQAFNIVVSGAAEGLHVPWRVEVDALTADEKCVFACLHHQIEPAVTGDALPFEITGVEGSTDRQIAEHRMTAEHFHPDATHAPDAKSLIMQGSAAGDFFGIILQIPGFKGNEADHAGLIRFNVSTQRAGIYFIQFTGGRDRNHLIFTGRDFRGQRESSLRSFG